MCRGQPRRFAADSPLEGDGFELVVPRCVVGGRLADAIAESAASSRLRRATALGRDDKSKMPRNPRRAPNLNRGRAHADRSAFPSRRIPFHRAPHGSRAPLPVSESRAVIVTLAALPILWTPNVVVARKVVGGFWVAIPGALLFAGDGWIATGSVFVWQIALTRCRATRPRGSPSPASDTRSGSEESVGRNDRPSQQTPRVWL